MDIEARFKESYAKVKKEETAKHFLMRVAKVKDVSGDPDSFVAFGFRVDNGQKVGVALKKSTSGQHVPVEGSVLRAEKITRVPAPSTTEVAFYRADYFHAYMPDSFCLQAIIQPTNARKNESTGMWSAQVNAYDVDTNDQIITADRTNTDLDQVIARMLMPWVATEKSSITHDVKGDALWGDGASGKPGLSPFVLLRILNQSFPVYGKGAVKSEQNGGMGFRLPTEQEVVSMVKGNPKLQALKTTINGLPKPDLPKLSIALIPGVSITVGRESLNGAERAYLPVPQAFDWKNHNLQDREGKPVVHPGFRKADLHVKASRTHRMFVAHAVASVGSTLTGYVPESAGELAVRTRREALMAKSEEAKAVNTPDEQRDAAAQQQGTAPQSEPTPQAKPVTTEAPAQHVAPEVEQRVAQPAASAAQMMPQNEAFDYGIYADDLRAMESMNAENADPDDVQDLLDEAAQRASTRLPRPTLG